MIIKLLYTVNALNVFLYSFCLYCFNHHLPTLKVTKGLETLTVGRYEYSECLSIRRCSFFCHIGSGGERDHSNRLLANESSKIE